MNFSAKLPVSRLQRDLTDSTVLRNIGVPFAHTVLAFRSLEKGLDKLILNESAIDQDLENNWAIVAEAIQTILPIVFIRVSRARHLVIDNSRTKSRDVLRYNCVALSSLILF